MNKVLSRIATASQKNAAGHMRKMSPDPERDGKLQQISTAASRGTERSIDVRVITTPEMQKRSTLPQRDTADQTTTGPPKAVTLLRDRRASSPSSKFLFGRGLAVKNKTKSR